MIQLYIKFTDNNYYLLDIEQSEVINLKTIVKDLNDITKIFSPFTQSFNIMATDKNKRLFGYVGNEKIQRINNDGKFDCLIYVSGFIYQSGKLSFEETNYKNKRQDKIKVNFASNLTGLANKLGDTTIQELFQNVLGNYDPNLLIDWKANQITPLLQSTTTRILDNGIELKYNIPFISNLRVWKTTGTINNITYTPTRNETNNNSIRIAELRPAVSYMTIMQHLLIKIGVPVVCPLFETLELKDLMAYCTGKDLVTTNTTGYLLKPFNPLSFTTDYSGTSPNSFTARWIVSGGGASGIFKIKRDPTSPLPYNWGAGIKLYLDFLGLASLDGAPTNIKVSLVNALNEIVIDSQNINTSNYSFTIIDNPTQTILDGSGELFFKFIIQPNTLVSWTSIQVRTIQTLVSSGVKTFTSSAINTSLSSSLGGDIINLISALPKIKAKDFLSSFFKMYNIQVINSGFQDGTMYWVSPVNINEVNKVYSKRIVDYTLYVDTDTLIKSRGNEYNQYIFKHKDSKYYDAIYGDGTRFGQLIYPTLPPDKLTKFEVLTEYSILKQNQTFEHPTGIKTCLAFEQEGGSIGSNGAIVYNPVFDEFTILYTKPVNISSKRIGLKLTNTVNTPLTQLLEPSFKHPTTGKTLAFGAEGIDTDSLYLNNYKNFIEFILNPNCYKSEFEINLPANEIFLNFSNQNIGESNIPTGFRPQNEIIIGEQKYILIESLFNLTSGKGKITVLNY